MSTETIEELAKKLEEHKAQLAHVEQMLASNPNDPTLMNLRGDLAQVVALTEDLTKNKDQPTASVSQGVPQWQPVTAAQTAQSVAQANQGPLDYKEGDRCKALWEDGKYYLARIDQIQNGPPTKTYVVTYLEFGDQGTVTGGEIKTYKPPQEDLLEPGRPIKAIYSVDGMFYDGVIAGSSDTVGKYYVKFFGKKKKKYEVPAYDIVLRADPKWTSTKNASQSLPDKVVVPENLWRRPEDTEEQRSQKKRKIKRLKQEFKKKKSEMEGVRKRDSWQNFRKGFTKKTGKKLKTSIFQTQTTLDATIGIIGSGKTMTPIPDHRRRNDYKHLQELEQELRED